MRCLKSDGEFSTVGNMAKLRHIALIVEDPEESAKFFTQAFGMRRSGEIYCGCYMTDGVISLALLKKEFDYEQIGIDHFGFWVDDVAGVGAHAAQLGATPDYSTKEIKYRTSDGILIEISEAGWPGSVKDLSID